MPSYFSPFQLLRPLAINNLQHETSEDADYAKDVTRADSKRRCCTSRHSSFGGAWLGESRAIRLSAGGSRAPRSSDLSSVVVLWGSVVVRLSSEGPEGIEDVSARSTE